MRCLLALAVIGLAFAEDGLNGWLRYASIGAKPSSLPSKIIALSSKKVSPVYSAGVELQNGFHGIFGKHLIITHEGCDASSAIVVGTVHEYIKACGDIVIPVLEEDGFWLSNKRGSVQIIGQNERGALYGAFEYLSMLGVGNFSKVAFTNNPALPVRWVNQWDNMDSSIERGYAGPSMFFANNTIVGDLTRAAQYARLLASVGINGVIVNNVNANSALLSDKNLDGLARIAVAFRPYGVQLGISLDFSSPQKLGNLPTFDPLDPTVITWWNNLTDKIYQRVPDFAGYLVKADSEGQPGPLTYNRTLADGANLFANALKPHGGIVMYRGFVYDKLDWTNIRNDRAKGAVEYFTGLDGKFRDNVIIQIKYGPLDFQVREPASPLFAHLVQARTAIELQVSQEYLGQQCHMVYLAPLWKTIFEFDLRINNETSLVSNHISGAAAVVNAGTNSTWLGNHLSMSNLHSYGRLAWSPTADVQSLLHDWICLTFSCRSEVVETITRIAKNSWQTFEDYSGNLGLTTLNDIAFNSHYGPSPFSVENNVWGFWTRADSNGVGMDRTVAHGTGFTGQYPLQVSHIFEEIDTTPDELLLFFHHVGYDYRLKSGKTVMQHFYDAHYRGAEAAHAMVSLWKTLKGKIDVQRYEEVLFRQAYQAGHSIAWRDTVIDYFHNLSHIPDEANRFGNYPWRVEAESMALKGYKIIPVGLPGWASNHSAIVTTSNTTVGTATATLKFPSGQYNLAINYYDLIGGKARFQAYVNEKLVGGFSGNTEDTLGHYASVHFDGTSATRVTFPHIQIKSGDIFKIVGTPHGIEQAPLDYVSFLPEGVID